MARWPCTPRRGAEVPETGKLLWARGVNNTDLRRLRRPLRAGAVNNGDSVVRYDQLAERGG